jgi:hypothetical protein
MIFLMNPGGGVVTNGGLFADDSVFILGVRIYVPF